MPIACRAGAGGRGGDAKTLATEAAPIEAVLVMTDPTDWGRDIQLIVDIVSSSGVLTSAPDLPAAKGELQLPSLQWFKSRTEA